MTAGATVHDYGEDRLIAELLRGFSSGQNVIVGVGDDCAVIGRRTDRVWQLLKTDCVVEGVHFEKHADPRKIGWKALARAISDIAAMGGRPQYALVTIAISPDEEIRRVKAIYTGLKKAAMRFDVSVVGGETSRSPAPMFISVALTGTVEKSRCVLRSGGRAGDDVFVTGRLGGSIHGKHLDFIPRVAEARWLTENFRVHAMMDLSDGLGADLPRLARASRCGFELFENALPLTRGCTAQQAIADGEDYELLFTVSHRDSMHLQKAWREKFPRLPLTRIGSLTRHAPLAPRASLHGFDHFAQPR